jgi:YggT family protein
MKILLIIIIFLELLSYLVILDVILSWLLIIWLKIRPKFVADIIDPLYSNIRKIIPTTFWPIDFTPIIVIILIMFIKWTIYILFPELNIEVNNLIN